MRLTGALCPLCLLAGSDDDEYIVAAVEGPDPAPSSSVADMPASLSSVRQPPMPATFNKNAPLGTCVWCGKDLPRNKDGSPSKVLRWHPDCVAAYRELIDTAYQVKLVEKRDGRRCFDCGRSHYVVGVKTWEVGSGFCGLWFGDNSYIGQGVHIYDWGDVDGPFTPVRFREIALELDHDVPLWRVAHLPDEERIKYFRIENMRLRCRECHKAKTAREAAERAKLKRIARKHQAHLDRMAEKSTWQAPS